MMFSGSLTRVGMSSIVIRWKELVECTRWQTHLGRDRFQNYFLIRRSRNRTGSGTDWRNDEKIPYNLEDNPPRFWDQNQLEPAPCFYSISYPNQWLCTRITSYSCEQPIKSRDTDLYASKRMKGVLSLPLCMVTAWDINPVTVRHRSCHELCRSQPQGSIQCIS